MKTLKELTALLTLIVGMPALVGLTIWFIGVPLCIQISAAFYPDMIAVYLLILLVIGGIILVGVALFVLLDVIFEKFGWSFDEESDRL